MQDIVIPLKVGNVGTVQNQLSVVGRQLAQLQQNAIVGNGRNIGNTTPRQPKAPPSLSQQLQNAVYSSRMTMNNGKVNFQPLVGRVMGVFGKFSPAVTGATLALSGLYSAASAAADSLTAFRGAQLTSGGTASQTAQLGAMGGAIGVSGQEMAQLSRNFSNKIATDGVAAGFAARAGIKDLGDVFGDTNKAGNLLKWATYLKSISETEAIRATRATEAEGLLPLRDLSDATIKQLEQDAKIRANIADPKYIQSAAEFNAQLDRMKASFDNLKMSAGAPLMDAATWLMKQGADFLNGIANGEMFADNPKTKEDSKPQSELKANTDATKQLNDTMQKFMKNGTYGGGERARSAIPRNWNGMNAAAWANAMGQLGPFNL